MRSPKKLQIALGLVLIAGTGGAFWMSAQRRLHQEQQEQAQQSKFLNGCFLRVQRQEDGALLSPRSGSHPERERPGSELSMLGLLDVPAAESVWRRPRLFRPGSRFVATDYDNDLKDDYGRSRYTITGIGPQGVGVRFERTTRSDIRFSGDIVLAWK